jgi:hypothetical protein
LNKAFFHVKQAKIIELQARREYEGAGEFPSYIGADCEHFARELEGAENMVGMSIWCQTGERVGAGAEGNRRRQRHVITVADGRVRRAEELERDTAKPRLTRITRAALIQIIPHQVPQGQTGDFDHVVASAGAGRRVFPANGEAVATRGRRRARECAARAQRDPWRQTAGDDRVGVRTDTADAAERGAFGIFKDLNAATLKDTQDVPFEFDIASLSWNVANGVLRVAIPRKAEFAGKAVLVANKDDIVGEIPADAGVNAAE